MPGLASPPRQSREREELQQEQEQEGAHQLEPTLSTEERRQIAKKVPGGNKCQWRGCIRVLVQAPAKPYNVESLAHPVLGLLCGFH